MGQRALLVLAALVLFQTLPALWSRDFVAGDEVRHADALRNLREEGHGVVLRMNGRPYPDKPPLWFWVVAGIQAATGWGDAPSFFLASALASVLLLWTTVWTARHVLGRGSEVALTAGAMLLATPLFLLFARTTRMDALFAALLGLGSLFVHRGLSRGPRTLSLPLAGLFGGLGTLVKGPVALLVPAVGAVLWLAWQRRLRRLLSLDVLAGVLVAAAVCGAWLVAVRATEGPAFVESLWEDQVLGRVTGRTAPGRQPFWFYAAAFPFAFWPWTAMVVAVPLGLLRDRARRAAALRAFAASRRTPGDGASYLVSTLVGGLLLLSIPQSKFFNYLLPLLVPACVLAAAAIHRMEDAAARRVLGLIGLLALLGAAALPWANRAHPWNLRVEGLVPAAIALGATGAAVLVASLRTTPARTVLALAAGTSATALVVALAVVPSLDPVLCPRDQARVLARAAEGGARVYSWRVYSGTYAYHAGRTIPESGDPADLERWLAEPGPVAIALPREDYESRRVSFEGLRILHQQWIVGVGTPPFVVAAREGPPDEAPPR